MKRDDFGVRIDEIRELATKYSKPDLARMVQMGMIEPQKALMAGMMIDRIAKSAMQPPQSTVAQDVLGQQPTAAQGQIPSGIMGAPSAPAPSAGVAALPSGITEMAGGGIVAFDEGGQVPGYADGDLVSASDTFRRGLATQPDGSAPPAPPADAGIPSLTLPGGYQFRPYSTTGGTNIKAEIAAEREAMREAGVDLDLYKRMREEEGARREDFAKRREEAKGEALLMAGLGLMGARRGQEFEVLAGVGRQAVQQYSSALRDIRETEKDIKKTERELMIAEDRTKRDASGRALARVQAKEKALEELQIRQTDQYNRAAEKTSDLFITKYGIDENAKRALEVAKMNGDYQLAVARIHERSANRLGETERLLGRYHDILAKQGPEAAAKFMSELEMVKGGPKPQNVMSFEEAMKIVANDPMNASKNLEQKKQLALDMMAADPRATVKPVGSKPPTTFNLSPEAQKALQQYGGK